MPEEFKPKIELIELAKELDKAYIPTRYPNVHPEGSPYEIYTENEAKRLIEYAKKLSNTVKIYYPEFNKEELIKKLKEKAEIISNILPLKLMILFGSYANGRYTAASDVDLLIVYNGLKREDDYSICWDILKNTTIRIACLYYIRI